MTDQRQVFCHPASSRWSLTNSSQNRWSAYGDGNERSTLNYASSARSKSSSLEITPAMFCSLATVPSAPSCSVTIQMSRSIAPMINRPAVDIISLSSRTDDACCIRGVRWSTRLAREISTSALQASGSRPIIVSQTSSVRALVSPAFFRSSPASEKCKANPKLRLSAPKLSPQLYEVQRFLEIFEHRDDPKRSIVDISRRASPACRRREREYIGLMAISSPDLKAFLLTTPFFGGLSGASLDLLVSMLVERRFDVGATVVAEGEPGRSMFIVHSGELVVSKLGDSRRIIRVADLEPGDFFGEMTLIEMQNRSATVAAESPTVLYELTAGKLYTYYKTDVHAYVIVMQNINRELCRRLRRADNRIAELQILHASR